MIFRPFTCPHCGSPLEGLGTFCWHCCRRPEEASKGKPEAAAKLPDTRSEDERKRDAKEAVEMLGWDVLDFEQGFRPFQCRHCGGSIAGGTRVPLGIGDWLVMGHGLAAWIEWKTDANDQTREQKLFEGRCSVAGVPYRVCRTTEQAVEFLEEIRQEAVR